MVKRGICFDLDGTLIDSGHGGLAQLCKVAKILNLPMSEKIESELRSMWGQHLSNLIKTAWPDTDIGKFYKQWEELDIAEPFPVFPRVKEVLLDLCLNNCYLSILTSRNFRTAIAQLEHNDLLQFFGLVIAADSSLYKKPDPRSIELIFDKYRSTGVNPNKVVFVGDTVEGDWKLAQATGLEFFAVLSGGMDTREKFLAAGVPEDHIIDSVADLPQILIK